MRSDRASCTCKPQRAVLGAGAPVRRCRFWSDRTDNNIHRCCTCRPLLCRKKSSWQRTAIQGANKRPAETLSSTCAATGPHARASRSALCSEQAHRCARAVLDQRVATVALIALAGPCCAAIEAPGSTLRSRAHTKRPGETASIQVPARHPQPPQATGSTGHTQQAPTHFAQAQVLARTC